LVQRLHWRLGLARRSRIARVIFRQIGIISTRRKIGHLSYINWRGRNYRHGPFHFHERDLVRSLIIFDESDDSAAHTINSDVGDRILHNFLISAAYHKSKFGVYQEALDFISKIIEDVLSKPTFFEKDIIAISN
jgi:hypothetical protein